LNKSRFAGPKIANQANDVSGFEQRSQAHTQPASLLRAAANKLHRLGVKDWHNERIINREMGNVKRVQAGDSWEMSTFREISGFLGKFQIWRPSVFDLHTSQGGDHALQAHFLKENVDDFIIILQAAV